MTSQDDRENSLGPPIESFPFDDAQMVPLSREIIDITIFHLEPHRISRSTLGRLQLQLISTFSVIKTIEIDPIEGANLSAKLACAWSPNILSQFAPDILVLHHEPTEATSIFESTWLEGEIDKPGALPLVLYEELPKEILLDLMNSKVGLQSITNLLDDETKSKCCGSITNQLLALSNIVLEDNDLTRKFNVMKELDAVVLPSLKRAGHSLAQVLPNAEDILLLPLIHFHSNLETLVHQINVLNEFPKTALLELAVDSAHVRLRMHPEGAGEIDLAIVPLILKIVTPYLKKRLETIVGKDLHPASDQVMSVSEDFALALSAVDLLARAGVFDEIPEFASLKSSTNRLYRSETLDTVGLSCTELRDLLNTTGKEYIDLMRTAAQGPLVHLFESDLPLFLRFANKLQGMQEIISLAKYNFLNSEAQLTFREILSVRWNDSLKVGSRNFVLDYFETHSRITPFSTATLKDIRNTEKTWRTFIHSVTGNRIDESTLVQVRPNNLHRKLRKNMDEMYSQLPEIEERMSLIKNPTLTTPHKFDRSLIADAIRWLNKSPMPFKEAFSHLNDGRSISQRLTSVLESRLPLRMGVMTYQYSLTLAKSVVEDFKLTVQHYEKIYLKMSKNLERIN